MDTIIEALKLVFVAMISGYFSAWLTLRGHRDKTRWETRVSAYQSLIEALSDLSYYYGEKFVEHIKNSTPDDVKEKQLKEFWDQSYHKVRKASDAGSFLFSIEVTSALKEFRAIENEEHESYFDYIERHSHVTDKCLNTVVKSAKKDLGM